MSERDMPAPGALVVGKYRVIQTLATSHRAGVLEAVHLVNGRRVALKWIPGHCGGHRTPVPWDGRAVGVGRVRHRNLVEVFELGQQAGAHYVVME